jgi:hypothetical protein
MNAQVYRKTSVGSGMAGLLVFVQSSQRLRSTQAEGCSYGRLHHYMHDDMHVAAHISLAVQRLHGPRTTEGCLACRMSVLHIANARVDETI